MHPAFLHTCLSSDAASSRDKNQHSGKSTATSGDAGDICCLKESRSQNRKFIQLQLTVTSIESGDISRQSWR